MYRTLKPGDKVYIKEVFWDDKRMPIIKEDEDGEEVPLVGWHEMIFQFYGHVEQVREVNGVQYIIRNLMVFAVSTHDPGMKIESYYPQQVHLARYDDGED